MSTTDLARQLRDDLAQHHTEASRGATAHDYRDGVAKGLRIALSLLYVAFPHLREVDNEHRTERTNRSIINHE